MKHLTSLIVVVCLGALILSACDDKADKTTPPSRKVNLLVATEGEVQLKREGWKDYVPVAFGTMIKSTDLLKVEGSAPMLCADLSLKTVSGRGAQPCPVEGGWLEYGGARFESGQRTMPSAIPYILHPRNTLVLDPRPHLRWNDTGAISYTVSIVSGGKEVWSQSDVAGAAMRYPDDAPTLQSGVDYLLTVRENVVKGHASTEDKAKGLGFQLLSEAERSVIEERSDAILALAGLDESARHLALAVYYAGVDLEEERGLWGEAWLLLESVARMQDAPAVHLLMGDLSITMKLPDEAEAAYRAALRSAEAVGDLESQAAANVGLWRVKGDKGCFDRALELYRRLGDEDAAEALREEAKP
jgi:hypothetical protein